MWGWIIYLVCVLGEPAVWLVTPSFLASGPLCKAASPRPQGAAVGGDAPQRCCGLIQVWLDPEVLPPASQPHWPLSYGRGSHLPSGGAGCQECGLWHQDCEWPVRGSSDGTSPWSLSHPSM